MKSLLIATTLLTVFSCAHHRDVRPAASGEHLVSFKTEKKGEGYQNAMMQAKHFCEQDKKTAYVVKEESKYTASMDEKDYETRKTAAKAISGVGSGVFVFGGKKESPLGGIAAAGGQIADEALGKGYTYNLRFTCK